MTTTNHGHAVALDAVREALAAQLRLDKDQIGEEERLDLLPNADSVRLMRAVSALERRFDVELDDNAIRNAETVADLARLIEDELARGGELAGSGGLG
jgi:acyl carrier protein